MNLLRSNVLLIILGSLLCALPLLAQQSGKEGSDSVRIINEVTVRSKIRYHETIAPQKISRETLEQMNAHSVADAMRFMSGVQLKDYGGVGGLKTVNLRSMGSQHVGVYYDGIELGNAQNGVIDLGQFSLDNIEEITLYQGQRSAILQTASDFANAGSIYLRTRNPLTYGKSMNRTRAKIQYGSGSLLRLSGLHEHPLSQRLTMSTSIEGVTGNGKYPFTYRRRNRDGSIAYDTTAIRQNGDITALRAEINLYGLINQGHWETKAYTYLSNRGIPGAIVNNVWRRGERQSDGNTMLQGSWLRDISPRQTLRFSGKAAFYHTDYRNQDTTQLTLSQTFQQLEGYCNVTHVAELYPWWSLSVSYDGRWNLLRADRPQFANPIRWTHMWAVASALDLNQLQLQGSLVYTMVNDCTKYDHSNHIAGQWTPALFANWQIVSGLQLTGFLKQSYRLPSFNDLYYTQIGNALLRPERATQVDLGLNLNLKPLSGSIHIYHNDVKDKIVAYPQGQQFRWTMLNLGKVRIDGIDLNLQSSWTYGPDCTLSALAQYTYQQARDVTDSNSSYYGHQIPYTPWHSGSASAQLTKGECEISYSFIYTGQRYCQPENIAYNHLQPWYTSDLCLAWRHCRGSQTYRLSLQVNNLFDQQYDVIINYPMPGRNYNLTLTCQL